MIDRTIRIALLPLVFLQAHAAHSAPPVADAWIGRPRSEVVALLGEPDRTSRGREGGQTLTYKFLRLREGAEAEAAIVVLDVPGVGHVARVPRNVDPFAGESVTIEPAAVDGRGRPTEGGLTTTHTSRVSWDPKDGPPPPVERPRPLPVAGKVKLTLELDATGHVRSWSQTPRKPALEPEN